MNLEIKDENIIKNCAKTAIKTLLLDKDLLNKSFFTVEEINLSLGKFLDGEASFRDYDILYFTCTFCLQLKSQELEYEEQEILQVLLKFKEFSAR